MSIYAGHDFFVRPYRLQKEIARKHLMRAKESRGTDSYKGALKRAQYEMAILQRSAIRAGVIHRDDVFYI